VNRLFFRFFVLVMLSITAAMFVVYFAVSRLFGDPLEDIARRQAAAQIFLLEQYVDLAPSDEWLVRLNKVREISKSNFELKPLADVRAALSPSEREQLIRGEVVLQPASKSFYRRVDLDGQRYVGSEEEVIHAQDLPIDIGFALQIEAVRYLIVALLILIPIALWSRAHWQGLQALSKVADDFGGGNLKARAQMARSASMYPLAERIDHMADRIEHLLDAQRGLLHSVSHEIRTPIARLEFALELLRDQASPAQERRIGAMEGDLRELNELVGELLGMTRLDSPQELQREDFDLCQMLQEQADALQPRPDQLDCALPDNLKDIFGDRRLLARAVGNLLRNAQKYANGHVALSARRILDVVEIVVEDNGPGIPDHERERIFDPFYRLDRSRDRATGGFGLGLSIAQKAVALHGGSIAVTASRLGGARFLITLPA
jgi:two-component system OmpR family sensor kinase